MGAEQQGLLARFPCDLWGARVSKVVIDSRQAAAGSVFVALRGERADGHQYVQDAFERGAICAIVERMEQGLASGSEGPRSPGLVLDLRAEMEQALKTGGTAKSSLQLTEPVPVCLVVEDSLSALQRLAAWWRKRFAIRVIGITGSVGKTTTKELVAAVLSQRYSVLKSQGSYNNEIGLPLTLLELDGCHEYAVLEMGTYGPGEITLLAQIACPHIGVVTNVGPVHLERMGTIECIAQAKSELPQSLPPDGVAILNADDEWVRSMADKTPARVFTYGLTPGCQLWADEIESGGLDGISLRFHYRGGQAALENSATEASWDDGKSRPASVSAHIPLLGKHNVHTALRAAAVGLVEGLSWDEILRGLHMGEQLRLVAIPGVNGSTLLDDTYNSSPDSAIAALNLLEELAGRKVAVLGDMLELGPYEVEGHRQVARRAADVVQTLITVGELGRLISQEAIAVGMPVECVTHVVDNDAAIACLQDTVQEDDIVLIKGSRGIEMEQIVQALARLPANGET
jgi:UDP-N-acetylmuramoyl-tripeptide--D-alanyl-D-alanine ligase